MNGLQGRMLYIPAPRFKKRDMLLVYGLHASLEHWWPLALELNRYGAVTMPDLPGFGGMQSFARIHEKPTLDSLADYLAAFVKLRYKNKRFTVVAVGFGFVLVTRMLQSYPDLAKKVDVVIGMGGLARYDDLTISRTMRILHRVSLRILATRPAAYIIKHTYLQPAVLRRWYSLMPPEALSEEIRLWRQNDVRTNLLLASALLNVDNCRQKVSRPLWYISMRANKRIDHHRLIQHLGVVYSHVEEIKSRHQNQSIGTVEYQRGRPPSLPAKLKRVLAAL